LPWHAIPCSCLAVKAEPKSQIISSSFISRADGKRHDRNLIAISRILILLTS
jgi:hypothetical protein